MGLDGLRKNKEIISVIDWDMTPEKAVSLYLEWGTIWSHGKNFIRSKHDISRYFVVNTWEDPPKIFFVQRNSEEAVDLATIDIPDDLRNHFIESIGDNRGVYAINDEIKTWLKKELYA
ncbi:MAG: hypothetical protein GWP10_04050 [Nitrospiraceae bacterium]|nr:hypothetical protein [Nitrospiraceae bacterium]